MTLRAVVETWSNVLTLKVNVLDLIMNLKYKPQSLNLRVTGSTPVGRTIKVPIELNTYMLSVNLSRNFNVLISSIEPNVGQCLLVEFVVECFIDPIRIFRASDVATNLSRMQLSEQSLNSKALKFQKQNLKKEPALTADGLTQSVLGINQWTIANQTPTIVPQIVSLQTDRQDRQIKRIKATEILGGVVDNLIKISVPNWEKFNPRNDRTNHVWFRFQNKFFSDQRVFPLTGEQQRLLIFIYCLRSEKCKEYVELSLSYTSAILKRKPKEIHADLQQLFDSELLAVDNSQPNANHRPTNGIATDRQTDKTDKTDKTDRGARATLPTLATIWNKHSGELPKVIECGSNRKISAKARWREKPDPEYWVTIIKKLTNSKFCKGDNERVWIADFDFLIKPETHIKAMEGKYDDKKSKHAKTGIDLWAEKNVVENGA